ncbi:MAG: FkbM family methyltransferase [Bryobacterales bacterium]|nr:FkbM family methyltransferase [Bryobacterales bacterium]
MSDIYPVFVNDFRIVLPARCRRIPGVDHGGRRGIYFEPYVMLAFETLVRPGGTVYDVGCSYGILSAVLARLVGPGGRVEAFEANPAVLAETGPILALNSGPRALEAGQIRLHPVCVGERSGGHTEFYVLPAAASVASTRNAEIRRFHANSTVVEAPMAALDDVAEATGTVPTLIKIDIEGGEYAAIQGARRLLAAHGPDLVIETHGKEIDGIQGTLAGLIQELKALGYAFADLVHGEVVDGTIFARRHDRQIGYLLASKSLIKGDLHARIRRRWRAMLAG